MTLKVGTKAPDFALPDENGKMHKLSDYKGTWVLIYFYPKDDTPGCTTEACEIRDNFKSFGKMNAIVLGVSADSSAKHKKFKEKYKLPFTLLSDESKDMIKTYNAWGAKKFMGRTYDGIFRMSYLINPEGKIAKIYEKVKPPEHATEVLGDLASKK